MIQIMLSWRLCPAGLLYFRILLFLKSVRSSLLIVDY
uniref:Uncharacterized protein n=1 Tax=Anguilla anguilla TaxID=7936 RepID=A0A0E9R458_ANGAN